MAPQAGLVLGMPFLGRAAGVPIQGAEGSYE